ncbi:hypothetical protein FQR65_LT01300 [Abscondita terminalis]|nr:hypothetical protein FQR65_LT01300 [Abscondita terminalis]
MFKFELCCQHNNRVMAEVHVIGEIFSAERFPKQSLFCKWTLQFGNNWKVISGKKEGQTHVVSSEFEDDCRWCFPIDVHLATKGVQGWPKIFIEVYHLDWWGRSHLFGYGFVVVPTTPGSHHLECFTWRPFGTLRERFTQFFLGGGPQLKNSDLILSANDSQTTVENVTTSVTEATVFCDANDTACGGSTTTTTLPPPTKTPSIRVKVYQHSVDTCTCDLHKNICDVNCCCDKDCSADDKKVFTTCHRELNVNRDSSFCSYSDYIYVNNTEYEWEVNQNGLFCIVKTNLPPKYTVQTYRTITTFEESQTERKLGGYAWPEIELIREPVQLSNVSYVYGSIIWLLRNHTLEIFELSTSFITHICLAAEKVRFLTTFESECSTADVDADNSLLQAATYHKNISFVRDPRTLNASAFEIWNCPKNVCVSVDVKVCDEDGNCAASNESNIAICSDELVTNSRSCLNLVRKVRYNFYHNGSFGITQVELLLTFQNVSYYLHDSEYELKQKFEVQFFWHNTTSNYSQLRSGNPGYIIGKPLLIGNLYNGTVSRKFELVRDCFLTFPKSVRGQCVLTNREHVLSEFGYNMMLKCRVRKEIDKKNLTASELCRKAQVAIFDFWPISQNASVMKVVGAFGNANESSAPDWIEVLLSNSLESILNASLGNFTDENRTVICSNLITSLRVDVFHGRTDLEKLLRQENVIAVAFGFGDGFEHVFAGVGDVMHLDAVIREEVAYFDVTAERVEKYASPPAFKISLPYDFFYPFVKVGNSAHAPSTVHFNFLRILMTFLLCRIAC